MNSSSFNQLTPDTIFTSIETLGYEPTGRCVPLNSVENRVYDIEVGEGHRIVVKYYRPGRWAKEQIQEEHDFLYELKDADIPVLAPIQKENKQSIFSYQDLFFAIWPLRNGRIIEEISEADLPRLGRLLGRIHLVGKSKHVSYRTKLDVPEYASKALQFIEQGGWIQDKHLLERYKNAALIAFESFDRISKETGVPFHRIHGDCHKGNLLHSAEGFSILDFDDFLEGPVVQDFWMLLPFGDSRSEYERNLFFEGYREFSEFSDSWLSLIEPLRAIRYIHYAAWIAKRWEDPAFPNLFPHFGSEEYWLKETIDLEQMGKSYHSDSITTASESETKEEELSNKDFFWDWEG